MVKKTSEKALEAQIVQDYLVDNNKYFSRPNNKYDAKLCMDTEQVLSFIFATQPEEWEKLKKQHGEEHVGKRFLKRLKDKIDKEGTLSVLRKGITDLGCHFELFFAKPSTAMNVTYQKKYEANMFSAMRQVYFSENNNKSVDLVIFINGLPIISVELKNQLSGQNVWYAIKQYRTDRDPREPFFKFKRLLVNFAVDEDLVYMATKLEGLKTYFLPFNKGYKGGAGNPDTEGYKSEYLWKEVLEKDSLSEILRKYLNFQEVLDDKGKPTGKEILIFPRYHQLDATRKIIADAKKTGTGKNYLIHHSAGSGKSNTIAWVAHQLAELHDNKDKKIFDSIIVITDRRILDKQLQRTIQQFEQVSGVVERIDKRSSQLKEALEKGKKIIITTIQKFPFVVEDIKKLPSNKFAVIIDEAHSSQSGEMSKTLKLVLKSEGLEEAEKEDLTGETWEDEIVKEMEARGKLKNVSYFAFTATPKTKTFELFGKKNTDGSFSAFHLYTMRQAIEEKFILDVLENYLNHKIYFNLLKSIKDDPKYDKKKATALLRSFVDLHEHAINKKISIMVEHFNDLVKAKIPDRNGKGQAKAMIVTRSRLHAVRYKLACDKYLRKQGYKYKAVVAFSGTVTDPDTKEDFTEGGMNGFSEKQTADEFKKSDNKFLIVANKFQTGYDEPLLYVMYVDKILAGVAAVQTLCRLNRTYKNKESPIVLDFANRPDDIEKAFEDYYGKTTLTHGTDPNKLYDLRDKLFEIYILSKTDIEDFAKLFFDKRVKQDKLHPVLNAIVERFKEQPREKQEDFKKTLRNFCRLYAFLSQVISFRDIELEKLYVLGRFLLKKLPSLRDRLPIEVMEQVDIDSYRIQKSKDVGIKIKVDESELEPSESMGSKLPKKDKEALSKIIEDVNSRFATEFSEADKVKAQELQARIASDPSLQASVNVNTKQKVRLTFDHLFENKFQEILGESFDFYKKVNDNKDIKEQLMTLMFEMIYKKISAKAKV